LNSLINLFVKLLQAIWVVMGQRDKAIDV